MNATTLFRAGDLGKAIAAAAEEVKADPGDASKRCFLADLHCFAGDLERADRQLDTAGGLQGKPDAGVVIRRQLLRAEQSRRQFFCEGRLPEFLDQPSDDLRLVIRASVDLREGRTAEAARALADAASRRPPKSGVCNGRAFDVFNDLDDLTSSFFEVFTATGRYFWIPFDRIGSIELTPPATTLDLLWRCARISLRAGPAAALDGMFYLPVLYHGSHAESDDRIKLGRMTDWVGGGDSPYRGRGQRLFTAGSDEVPALELVRIDFEVERGKGVG